MTNNENAIIVTPPKMIVSQKIQYLKIVVGFRFKAPIS